MLIYSMSGTRQVDSRCSLLWSVASICLEYDCCHLLISFQRILKLRQNVFVATFLTWGCVFSAVNSDRVRKPAFLLLQGVYARRENMTDVIIETLSGGARVRLKCKSHVRKMAVYENLVAVQVNQSFVVYERGTGEGESIQYSIKAHMAINRECDLLQVLNISLFYPNYALMLHAEASTACSYKLGTCRCLAVT